VYWHGQFYIYVCLPSFFGLRSVSHIFKEFSTSIHWIFATILWRTTPPSLPGFLFTAGPAMHMCSPSVCNDIADTLSHFQIERFQKLAPNANPSPDNIPAWPMQTFMQASCSAGIVAMSNPPNVPTTRASPSFSHSATTTSLHYYLRSAWLCNTSMCTRLNTYYTRLYLAAICLRHIEQGFYDPTTDNLLQLVCRGIHRQQGDKQCIRQPITLVGWRRSSVSLHTPSQKNSCCG